ncbi:10165_t:CDS:2, partial [Racocetra persica]
MEDVYENEPKPWFSMSEFKDLPTEPRNAEKEFDKIIRNISYHASAVLHPIDNIGRILQNSKLDDNDTEAKAGYELLQRDRKGVFGDKLKDLIKEENTKAKLYNNANKDYFSEWDQKPPIKIQKLKSSTNIRLDLQETKTEIQALLDAQAIEK